MALFIYLIIWSTLYPKIFFLSSIDLIRPQKPRRHVRQTETMLEVLDQVFLIGSPLSDMHDAGVTPVEVIRHDNMVEVFAQPLFETQLSMLVDHLGTLDNEPVGLLPTKRLIEKRGDVCLPSSLSVRLAAVEYRFL